MAAATGVREAARRDVGRLTHRGLGVPDFVREVTRIVRRVVPAEGFCLLTIDPATMLPTWEMSVNGLPGDTRRRLAEIELGEHDFNRFTDLARGPRHAASLSGVTGGALDRSVRQRELRRPSGFADELRATLPSATGTWGALTLLRETGRPYFSPAETRFMASIANDLGDGLRRAMLLAGDRHGVDAGAGIVILAADDTVEMADPAGDRWLDELNSSAMPPSRLPLPVRVVAIRARGVATGDGRESAEVRVRTRNGQWLVVRGSVLGAGPQARVAVLLELAGPAHMAPVIVEAYGLTERERRVTELVARGYSTTEIAGRLKLSAYTVQDHLKSIFGKSGASSRGDLVARIFFDHHHPRLAAVRDRGPDQ